MSGSGLWFSRFTSGGEGWLPLVAFGSAAWMFVAAGTAPDGAETTASPAVQTASQPRGEDGSVPIDAEGSGFDAATRGELTASAR